MAVRLKRWPIRDRISPFEKHGQTATQSPSAFRWNLRQEPLPGDDSITAALYGPLVLAADLGAGPADGPMKVLHGRGTEPKDLPTVAPLPKIAAAPDAGTEQWVQVDSPSDLRFSVAGESTKYSLMPMYEIGDQKYSVYWQMQSQAKKS